jgi:iodotyrosine deiodinase
MGFLNSLLHRPDNEKPYILLVVGYPGKDCTVPNIRKKPLSEIASFL